MNQAESLISAVAAGGGEALESTQAQPLVYPDTTAFLKAASAAAAVRSPNPVHSHDRTAIDQFAAIYKAWIIRERGMSDAPDVWARKNLILLHLMIGGATIREAIEIHVKFRESVWGPNTKIRLVERGDFAAITFDEPFRPGVEGLICELWPIAVTLHHYDFFCGSELKIVRGEVRNSRLLPVDTMNLLFGKPIIYEAQQTALVIERRDLDRAIVVHGSDITDFQASFMHDLINKAKGNAALRASVSSLIWNDIARGLSKLTTMPEIAERLGLSASTLRRRLVEEKINFQDIKHDVLDQLAKMYLRSEEQSIESIADKLGYSDAHAFRRAFRRVNGISPRDYKRILRREKTEGDVSTVEVEKC